jgi:hypothetical protein
MEKKSKTGKILLSIFIILIILLLAGAAAWWIFMTPGYITRGQAVSNYYASISNEDKELYKNACYTKEWQEGYINGEAAIGIDAAIDVSFEFQSGASYGEVEVTALEKMDKEYADKLKDTVKNLYNVDMPVSALSKVNFTIKTSFEGAKENSGTLTRYAYKSRGKWYFLVDPETLVLMDLEG